MSLMLTDPPLARMTIVDRSEGQPSTAELTYSQWGEPVEIEVPAEEETGSIEDGYREG
mgnify:CR=1 FL=1